MGKVLEKRALQIGGTEAATHISKKSERADMFGDSTPPPGVWTWLGSGGEILQMVPVKGSGHSLENTYSP